MNKSTFISRLSGIFFLLLFTLSVTPKRFLHDALANHHDSEQGITGNNPEVFASGFQCHADDLVVEAPFLPEPGQLNVFVIPSFHIRHVSPLSFRIVRPALVYGVRGPPVTAVS